MPSTRSDEAKRTSPLALWRYAHDYLRAAQSLCRQHQVASSESQAPYHIATEGLQFTVKAYLRAKGATMDELNGEIGHSLARALARGEANGLPEVPSHWRPAIAELAACCHDDGFVYLGARESSMVDIGSVVDAGVWMLDRIAPEVAEHYVAHLATDASPSAEEFVRRLRADLSATSSVVETGN